MQDDRSQERTETDERVAENRTPPFGGAAQEQAFGSINDPIEE
jgi:hypothetical protein